MVYIQHDPGTRCAIVGLFDPFVVPHLGQNQQALARSVVALSVWERVLNNVNALWVHCLPELVVERAVGIGLDGSLIECSQLLSRKPPIASLTLGHVANRSMNSAGVPSKNGTFFMVPSHAVKRIAPYSSREDGLGYVTLTL